MKYLTYLIVIILLLISLIACTPTEEGNTSKAETAAVYSGPYLGQKLPGEKPELFGKGLFSTGIHDDGSPRFSADLKEVYFRKFAVPHDIIGFMKEVDGEWTKPVLFKPAGEYVVMNPVFIPGTNKAVFSSRMPIPGTTEVADFNPWIAGKTENGWGELKPVEGLGHEGKNLVVSSAGPDGTLYFQANLEDSLGGFDFYYSEFINGEYQELKNLGAPVNTDKVEAGPCISPDGTYLLYCAHGYEDCLDHLDLYVAFKKEDGSWTKGYNLGDKVNSENTEKFPSISPDGKYFFFVGGYMPPRQFTYTDLDYEEMMKANLGPRNGMGDDVYWASTSIIEKIRKEVLK